MKDIKDYLHFYLGQEMRIMDKAVDKWSNWKKITPDVLKRFYESELSNFNVNLSFQVKLRPLSDITDDVCLKLFGDGWSHLSKESIIANAKELFKENGFYNKQTNLSGSDWNKILIILRKEGYDCDGLIEAGLAIYKTKVTK